MYLPHVPDIRFCREDSVQEGFWRHPLDGQHGLAALAVVVRPVDVPRHPEVRNLHHAVLALARQQTVPGVSVVINFLCRYYYYRMNVLLNAANIGIVMRKLHLGACMLASNIIIKGTLKSGAPD